MREMGGSICWWELMAERVICRHLLPKHPILPTSENEVEKASSAIKDFQPSFLPTPICAALMTESNRRVAICAAIMTANHAMHVA